MNITRIQYLFLKNYLHINAVISPPPKAAGIYISYLCTKNYVKELTLTIIDYISKNALSMFYAGSSLYSTVMLSGQMMLA
jgi:hypothetical protein